MRKPTPPTGQKPAPTQTPSRQQSAGVTMQQWQGPLPPPAALDQFNQIIPNGADRILRLVEQEQEFRIQHESKKLDAAIWDSRLGKTLGFLLSASCVGGSVYTSVIGAHPTVSIALVSLPVMIAIRALIGRRQ